MALSLVTNCKERACDLCWTELRKAGRSRPIRKSFAAQTEWATAFATEIGVLLNGAKTAPAASIYNVSKDKEGYFNRANDPEHAVIRSRISKGYPNIKRSSR